MNEPTIDEPAISGTEPLIEVREEACHNLTSAVLCAIGVGLAIGLIVRALRPDPTPTQRATHLLADLEERLRDATGPAFRRAGAYASNGAGAVRDSLHGGEARLQHLFREATRGVRRLFS